MRSSRAAAPLLVVALLAGHTGAAAQGGPDARLADAQRRLDAANRDAAAADASLQDSRSRLSNAERDLADVRGQVGNARGELQAADRQLADFTARLRESEEDLAAAQRRLEESEAAATAAGDRLARITDRLRTAQDRLDEFSARFEGRIADTYKYGGNAGLAAALIGAEDIADLMQTAYLLETLLQDDEALVERIESVTGKVAADRAEADRLRAEREAQRVVATEAREEVAATTETVRRLRAMVEDERNARAQVLADLESRQADYEDLVASIAAESQALEQQLREAQGRAESAAASKAAAERAIREEAARQAEAARAAARRSSGGAAPAPAPAASSSSILMWPTAGRLTSGFGMRRHPKYGTVRLHAGIDIGAGYGQPIVAADGGQVVSAGWMGGYGLGVVIDHGGGLATLYAHMSRVSVRSGQAVGMGQKVGEVGSTGVSTGPHLHFETRVYGSPVNPLRYF